jgi:hypothetical protein
MPLEVRQIGIRMQVGDDADGTPAMDSEASSSTLDLLRGANDDEDSGETRLIEQCVERVLAELARRSER